jgi:glycosyltransferase involved in cell wall biosynthesis
VCWIERGPAKFRGLSISRPLIREIIRFKPDIIHVNYLRTLLLIATFVASLLRIPIIGVAHGSDIRGRTQTVRRAIMRLFLRRINKVIITAPHFAREAHMVPREKMVHIARMINTSIFRPGIDHSVLESRFGKNVILSVASLTAIKTPEKVLRAFRLVVDEVPSAQLLFCGDGPLKAALIELRGLLKLENNVEFLSWVPNSQLPLYYNLAIAEAHSFNIQTPALDVAHLEALACGTPVITYVGKQYPGVLKTFTEKEIAAGIIKVLTNKAYAKKLGAMGRKYVVKEYGYETVAQQMLKLYKSITK